MHQARVTALFGVFDRAELVFVSLLLEVERGDLVEDQGGVSVCRLFRVECAVKRRARR